jgi:hypothetical protein
VADNPLKEGFLVRNKEGFALLGRRTVYPNEDRTNGRDYYQKTDFISTGWSAHYLLSFHIKEFDSPEGTSPPEADEGLIPTLGAILNIPIDTPSLADG